MSDTAQAKTEDGISNAARERTQACTDYKTQDKAANAIGGKAQKSISDKAQAKATEQYFRACDLTQREITQKNGSVTLWQLPYTFHGLCAALSLSPNELLTLAERDGAAGHALKNALCRIAAYQSERALLGEFPHQMVLPLLREIGFLAEDRRDADAGAWEVRLSADADALAN